ncbi:ATP-binding cassette domain-containing protein [Tepidamorphus sp. 3E244]|uniref:ATP-binding cassette domain-containing protein n=1 Tax=Tepidamorphus sp. 3E244 TaxID=3385498 RepID=UPI0038FCE277
MADPENQLVSLDKAGIRRGDTWPVRGVTLSVARGEIVTLIGPNGSGKSTTVKLALGIVSPDEGTASRARGLRVAYVPQTLAIDWTLPLSVTRFLHLTGAITEDEAKEALTATGIPQLAGAQMQTLSGGEFQRALLARAMCRKPDLLVLDEPVQGVDFNGEVALYELIAKIRDRLGCGILMVSHDLHIVMAATDRVICLNGHVCCEGSPSAVADAPAYRQLFGGRGSPAHAIYQHSHDHTHLPDGRVKHADGTITESCHPDDGHHHHHDHEEHDHAR